MNWFPLAVTSVAQRGALVLFALCFAPLGMAQCPHFWRSAGYPGTDHDVLAMIEWDPDGAGPSQPVVVLGGSFLTAGTAPAFGAATYDPASGEWTDHSTFGSVTGFAKLANGDLVACSSNAVRRWNGTTWSSIGATPPGSVPVAVARMPNGDLVAGGLFTSIGGVNAANIARWNGTIWSPLGTGTSGTVKVLLVLPNGDLIAAGRFSSAGGVAANNIARWDGATWSPLGAGVTAPVPAYVYDLEALPNGHIVAGGYFTTAGSVTANSIARWDGSTWSSVGGGVSNSYGAGGRGPVHALATLPNGHLVAGGRFTSAGGVPAGGIAEWDGATWSPIGTGNSHIDTVFALLPLPNGDLLMGGDFSFPDGVPAFNVARWNGTAWVALAERVDTPVRALATLPSGELVAGASLLLPGGVNAPGIVRSDTNGTHWSALGGGVSGNVAAMAVLPQGDLVAAGTFTAAGVTPVANIARWDGTSWSPLGIGLPGAQPFAVTALANGDVVVGGAFGMAGGVIADFVARWDGTAWSALGSGTDGAVYAFATLANGDLVAGGGFTTAGGVPVSNIARWDGASWSPLGAGTNGVVRSLMTLPTGELVAGGDFTTAGGSSALRVARWNGVSWSPLGAGTNGPVHALTTLPDGRIVAGGDFTAAGGVNARYVAQWNGVAWSCPGDGVDYRVDALATMPNGALVLGGQFHLLYNYGRVPFIAFWRTTCPAAATQQGNGCVGSAGPVHTTSNLPWVGSVCRSRTTGFATNAIGAAVFGFTSPGSWIGLLHPAAGPACDLHASPDATVLLFPIAGAATFDLAIPNSVAFVDVVLFHQVVQGEWNASGQLTSLTSSNGLRLEIGAF